MKAQAEPIWEIWEQGGPFVGDKKPIGRVTVEWAWNLNAENTGTGNWPVNKLPIRWYEPCVGGAATAVMDVPNVKSITIDRSIDADADTCSLVIYNTKMKTNTGAQNDLSELGQPGYFTPAYGLSPEETARWRNHGVNDWVFALTPNTLLRTYQGYGSDSMTLDAALISGNLVKTGTWLCDKVKIGTDGMITLECRSMAKLLLDQQLYPPLVPKSVYPLHYFRFKDVLETKTRANTVGQAGPRNLTYDTSANLAWYSGGTVHGHNPADAFDSNDDTYYLSVGNAGGAKPYAVEWVQGNVGEYIDTVTLTPWAGNYQCYISIMVDGVWQDENAGATIPYDPLSVGRYRNPTYEPSIHYVSQFGVPWETPITVKLPHAYNAQKIRFTFTNLAKSPYGPYPYRAGLRSAKVSLSGDVTAQQTYQEWVRYDGNYKDYVDIVKDLLLWSGFWCKETLAGGQTPAVRGRMESTGVYSTTDLDDALFDKRPVIDPITEIKQVVGYIFYVDEEGGANFCSPNWWEIGNYDENGLPTEFIPQIDERVQLTNYTIQWSDDTLRSEIIIASSDPLPLGGPVSDIVVTRYEPNTRLILRGMCKPAMWVNQYFTSPTEQATMAEMIAMHTYFRLRQGNVDCAANPAIQIDDQVRIYERMTGEVYVHYVRGIHSSMDLDTGQYVSTLTTHWLGNPNGDWILK